LFARTEACCKRTDVRRIIAILVVALLLSPGLLWREPPAAPGDGPQRIAIRQLELPQGGAQLAPGLTLSAAWQLASRSDDFGGYSAMVPEPGGDLLLFSDRGRYLRLTAPGTASLRVAIGTVSGANSSDKRQFDIEAATRDPASGAVWLAYENSNAIRRYPDNLDDFDEVRPPEMQSWRTNSGPEAFVRLADGRFVVLSEVGGNGLLFAGDPVMGVTPTAFRFVPPADFRPTDMAVLPDGRVVILLRRLQLWLPPRLTSRLVVADPATIEPGEEWAWVALAEIAAPLPAENYEGLAIEPLEPGRVRLWLASDDNRAVFQRTLLLALDWDMDGATKKARGSTAGPSKPSR
jgi:hypothetical protein